MNQNLRANRWAFTWNNPPQHALETIQALQETGRLLYILAGRETAPTTGTQHLQGYMEFTTRTYRTWIQNQFPSPIHLEPARGTRIQNQAYCRKEDPNPYEWKSPQFEERTARALDTRDRQERTREMLSDYQELSAAEFEAKWTWEAFHQANQLRAWRTAHIQDNTVWDGNLQSKNFWIYGPPATGKSRWANTLHPRPFKKNLNKWWDGYVHWEHCVVILEDFDPQTGKFLTQHLKIWADRYLFIGECKGSHLPIYPGKFLLIVTSNYSIEQCFENPEDQAAIKRRFSEVFIPNKETIRHYQRPDFSQLQ